VSKLAFYTQFNLQKPYKVSGDLNEFSEDLSEVGVCIERWSVLSHLPSAPILDDDVYNYYKEEINRVKVKYGYSQVDFATMRPNDAFSISVRGRYLSEHTHEEDEVRFFLSGKVLIYLNINHKIHILECTKGDFVIIPAGVKHWMDIGPKPDFSVIRWFNSKKAFINHFTEGFVAEATPRWETIYNEAHFNI
tara:strand:- start:1512 stop:2087 length:576 start_codon:yes stop_codon:yes gene_type:complete